MRIAFGVEGYIDRELKDDQHYVKIFTRLVYKRDGHKGELMIPHRRCRPDDFDHFAPVMAEAEGLLKQYKESPNRNLLCLDWDQVGDDLAIWGSTNDETSY